MKILRKLPVRNGSLALIEVTASGWHKRVILRIVRVAKGARYRRSDSPGCKVLTSTSPISKRWRRRPPGHALASFYTRERARLLNRVSTIAQRNLP